MASFGPPKAEYGDDSILSVSPVPANGETSDCERQSGLYQRCIAGRILRVRTGREGPVKRLR